MKLHTPHDGPLPQPSSRYAKIASLARAFGARVRDDDFEHIDAFIETTREWQGSIEQDERDAEFLRLLGIQPLRLSSLGLSRLVTPLHTKGPSAA
jgi:hypothetical protein